MIYFPNFYGVCISAVLQLLDLAEVFRIWHMTFNNINQSSFVKSTYSMVNFIVEILRNGSGRQKVYVMGICFAFSALKNSASFLTLKLKILFVLEISVNAIIDEKELKFKLSDNDSFVSRAIDQPAFDFR